MMTDIAQKLQIDGRLTLQVLTSFVREEVRKAGFERVILGLSGGIDSALVAYIAVRALGAAHVTAVMMPYKTSSAGSLSDARAVADDLGLIPLLIDITQPVDVFFSQVDAVLDQSAPPLRRGNRMARERMCTLFDLSAALQALVLGTSNKTELLLGYGTQFGDMASALNPIGDLYKHQIRQLSQYVGVPSSILDKAPSADLWENQTDESELGFGYNVADEILFQLIDLRYSVDEVASQGYDKLLVERLSKRVVMNHYKRKPPIIAKVSTRTVGVDFRYLRDSGR